MYMKVGVVILMFFTFVAPHAVADDLQLGDIISGPGSASATAGGTTTTVTTDASGRTTTTETETGPNHDDSDDDDTETEPRRIPYDTDDEDTETEPRPEPDTFGDSVTSDNMIDRNGKIVGPKLLREAVGPGALTDLEMAGALLFGDFYVEGPFWVEWHADAPPVSSRDLQVSNGDIKPLSQKMDNY